MVMQVKKRRWIAIKTKSYLISVLSTTIGYQYDMTCVFMVGHIGG